MLSHQNKLIETDDEPSQLLQQLRKALELDTLPKINDPEIVTNVTRKFLSTANNKKQFTPQLMGIGGGPCAGKSFLYECMQQNHTLLADAVTHDPDLVMQAIPQYIQDANINPVEAFKKWELPARQLANDILFQALLAGYNIVYMRSFALADSLNFVRCAIALGYQFEMHLMTCDLDVALARAKVREDKIRRHIPPQVLAERHAALAELIPEIRGIAHRYFIYENNSDDALPMLKESA